MSALHPLKVAVSTLVDSNAHLFQHRVWPCADPAFPGWTTLTFWPGWLGRTASGRVCVVTSEVCETGDLDATLDRIQARYGVRLALRPVRVPTTWPRGNGWWPETACGVWELHLSKAHTGLKAAA